MHSLTGTEIQLTHLRPFDMILNVPDCSHGRSGEGIFDGVGGRGRQ